MPGPRTLSKSDFKIARECDARLFFRENGYPDSGGSNPYLRLLAWGGYMVETLACAQRPHGIRLARSGSHQADFDQTRAELQKENVTLFGGTFLWQRRLARVDILEKRGNELHLFEVKSGTYGGESLMTKKGTVSADWKDYVEDVAFQAVVLERLFPQMTVRPYLILVDKRKRTTVENLPSMFEITTRDGAHGTDVENMRFTGDQALLAQIDLLTELPVHAEVASIRVQVDSASQLYEDRLDAKFNQAWSDHGSKCKKCAYYPDDDAAPSGFAMCWGELADPKPHVLDLYKVGQANAPDGAHVAEYLFANHKAGLFDVNPDWLVKKDGTPGKDDEFRRRQLACMQSGETWVGDGLRGKAEQVTYPLHFIDFEVSQFALPHHANMRAYGQLAFQWSCHTVDAPGAEPSHREFLNNQPVWPNLDFVRSLKDAIGRDGTVLIWSPYEKSILNKIAAEHEVFAAFDQELVSWVSDVVDRRCVDMHEMARNDFYNPGMKGRTSIKVVLDALWKSDPAMREQFARWCGRQVGADEDPYKALPDLVVAGVKQSVHEGTGAVRAYEAMMYGAEKNDVRAREQWRALLLQYCHLDTLSMVLVWEHWRRITGLGTAPGYSPVAAEERTLARSSEAPSA